MDEYLITDFLEAIRGEEYEHLFFVTLFTGMRKGEVLGLTWDCVDFSRGTILIDKQLQRPREGDGKCILVTTKNSKSRKLKPGQRSHERSLSRQEAADVLAASTRSKFPESDEPGLYA